MTNKITRRSILLAGVAAGLTVSVPALAAQNRVQDVRLWVSPDSTRIVLDTNREADHLLFTLKSPDRIVVDIKDTLISTSLNTIDTSNGPVKRIRSGVRNGRDLRLVMDLSRPVTPKSFVLPPNHKYGHRLVIDLDEGADNLGRSREPVQTASDGDRDIVIAIDAGHGGEDPGAIGPAGTYEKDIVLAMAKAMKKEVDSHPGYRGVLTRTGDYYVDLRGRTELARKYGADLFVSIHADAFKSSRPRGASVFALSQSGATSETAKWLANKENRADLIGGAGPLSIGDKQAGLASVLLDLSMTASINTGINVGTMMLDELKGITKLHKRHVEQAGFAVLKSPDIPSLLVESGFISNPDEERLLKSPYHQQKLVSALFKGVKEYFQAAPPPGTLIARQRNERFAQN